MGAFFGPKDWGKLLTAMLTPFHEDGSVNYDEAGRLAAYLVDKQKNDGLVVNGTTGESPTLTEEEKLKLLEVVLAAVGDRAAVIFGAGTYNTAESIHVTREADRRGAHGIMLVNPYYNKPGQAGLYAHFSTIAKETELPVMLYNIMPRSSINLETSTLLRLAEIRNIVAVKEASGSIPQISDVCRQAPEGFRIYSGDDALTLPILSLGGHGLVSVAAHIVGDRLKEMIERFPTDPKGAAAIHHELTPTFKAIFSAPSPVPIKYATSKQGFACANVRLPLVELSDEERAVVDAGLGM
ncbi:4-hydroxy-tetrahydrodipicolinate synthase [Fimbriimonas ginsengisoli]|uniref:4-hydroxy-tetrahydrodipicolinate synthase n=1 Tax=Fimbriimonas ginsengisoli Gsoil 348 TaxID=661478 RepID=A0A068NX66_FIMGI|nr:4-hydroxy-tetrahydrodipicolinate synthase [Fimbriimonas ginsengisoli]AIE88088.1 dihydrodipicolinate synthase [Fimbriimonas ginsengisoli Gsoil 348]